MLPLKDEYEMVFRGIKVIGQKCMNINILTPFLLAILRHRQAFHEFISQVDDRVWVQYLNGIVFGLIYNFKMRIL
jgi:Na+/phosphate symporter